ncbi:MAG: sugar ABC transporter, partial [Hyphomonas sp.]|nr:sugar ABC transporter [Hyphomonas sp.]
LIAQTGIFVMATHQVSLMKQMCNRGIVLKKGQIVFDGDLEEALAMAAR